MSRNCTVSSPYIISNQAGSRKQEAPRTVITGDPAQWAPDSQEEAGQLAQGLCCQEEV